ncbi:hypothetical protein HPB50_022209 [Hyalomma asiaticum]|uniref:Uncharacterized protein n=1 Tax=Hyalomma asiaticum TaxID=266040 RepID=A0ACB7SBE7_HYAAI|nr:hypothetical protein HPB50_022209 [Hyalomma asiaticum]
MSSRSAVCFGHAGHVSSRGRGFALQARDTLAHRARRALLGASSGSLLTVVPRAGALTNFAASSGADQRAAIGPPPSLRFPQQSRRLPALLAILVVRRLVLSCAPENAIVLVAEKT